MSSYSEMKKDGEGCLGCLVFMSCFIGAVLIILLLLILKPTTMIKQTSELTTEVVFGTSERASIRLHPFTDMNGMRLKLTDLLSEHKVGDNLSGMSIDSPEQPNVVLNFSTPESVDAVIKALEHLKKQYWGIPRYYLAC